MNYTLDAETRTIFGKKVKQLRQVGKVPAEIYGRETDNQSIQVDGKTLTRVLQEAGSTNLIEVKVDGKQAINALARNIQISPVKRDLLHVDFYAVIMTETVTVSVPIQLIGESTLIKDEGGTLVSGLNELDIEALPGDLPEVIEVDISTLESFSDSVSVADISLPDTITILSNLESMVATIQPPRVEEDFDAIDAELAEGEEVEGAEGEAAEGGEDGDDE